MELQYRAIGTIHSPYTDLKGMPIQPAGAAGIRGTVKVDDAYVDALADLEGFSHIILLYHFHRSPGFQATVVPFLDNRAHGLFATRAPRRPNPIGLSVVRLLAVDGGVLQIENVDILDGTPLLDIKPYVPQFNAAPEVRTGWLEQAGNRAEEHRADDRFV